MRATSCSSEPASRASRAEKGTPGSNSRDSTFMGGTSPLLTSPAPASGAAPPCAEAGAVPVPPAKGEGN